MRKLFYLSVFVISLMGCETAPPVSQAATPHIIQAGTCERKEYYAQWYLHQEATCNNYIVEFTSDPPGAKIEVENNYVGQTPCSLKFDGTYSTTTTRIVNAYPNQSGQYVQRKVFNPGEFYPQKMYFNMNVGPVTPAMDVNVNK